VGTTQVRMPRLSWRLRHALAEYDGPCLANERICRRIPAQWGSSSGSWHAGTCELHVR
jgi:hypothetical protein